MVDRGHEVLWPVSGPMGKVAKEQPTNLTDLEVISKEGWTRIPPDMSRNILINHKNV